MTKMVAQEKQSKDLKWIMALLWKSVISFMETLLIKKSIKATPNYSMKTVCKY